MRRTTILIQVRLSNVIKGRHVTINLSQRASMCIAGSWETLIQSQSQI